MKYDLHIHTRYSPDGVLEPASVVKRAIKAGLRGIAVTDHNTIRGGLEVKRFETEHFKVIIGSEIKTDRGEITGLFLSREVEPGDAKRVFSEIKSQGGMTVIPHPFDSLRHAAFRLFEEDLEFVDAIEVFNSRCVFPSANRKALDFAREHHLAMVAGSDAHFANEIGSAGIDTELEDIREAMAQNRVRIFGKRSSPLNHLGTKAIKIKRKWT